MAHLRCQINSFVFFSLNFAPHQITFWTKSIACVLDGGRHCHQETNQWIIYILFRCSRILTNVPPDFQTWIWMSKLQVIDECWIMFFVWHQVSKYLHPMEWRWQATVFWEHYHLLDQFPCRMMRDLVQLFLIELKRLISRRWDSEFKFPHFKSYKPFLSVITSSYTTPIFWAT